MWASRMLNAVPLIPPIMGGLYLIGCHKYLIGCELSNGLILKFS